MNIKKEIKEVRYIECDGIKFYETKTGYWLGQIKGKAKRLHSYVWEKENGRLPKGYCIHHKDHDKSNNEISNLELVEKVEHLKYHRKFDDKDLQRDNLEKYARPKASEWHKSEEGSRWHKEHYEKTKHKLHKRVLVKCICCGKEVEKGKSSKINKFCSDKCRWKYKLIDPKYNIKRNCVYCSNEFTISKYSSKKLCSDECRGMYRNESKKHRKS